jgi:hypothetical protein
LPTHIYCLPRSHNFKVWPILITITMEFFNDSALELLISKYYFYSLYPSLTPDQYFLHIVIFTEYPDPLYSGASFSQILQLKPLKHFSFWNIDKVKLSMIIPCNIYVPVKLSESCYLMRLVHLQLEIGFHFLWRRAMQQVL